ncbi:hypothetical protein Pfo_022037 [Paulownia fortunei]|nr:hypothetical protein Pfo_022037 [Paulownia fortunei]
MENSCLFISVVVLLLSSSITQSLGKTFSNSTTDQYALLAFKNTITSDPDGILVENWSSNTSICYWIGVSCSTKHHRAIALIFSGFKLGGTIAPHLGNLTFLRSLDISSNNFTGFIPPELSNLRRLKEINLRINSFRGEIPSWFGALPELQHMHLNNNAFSGRIPPSLFNISKLQTLNMGYNFLGGNIPQEIGNYSFLKIVNLEHNQFTSSIPHGIFNMSSMITINLRYNNLSDRLPSDICSNTPKLKRIYLSENQLYGQIPPNIYKCRELEDLRLPINHFNGKIPSEIGNLTMLRMLSLSSNEFKGELPEELANLAYLEFFIVRNNSLSGSIPSSMFNISTLKNLDFSANQFSGSLPSTMGLSLFNLEELYFHSSGLSGEIPSSITNASKLTILDMSNNSFRGSMPNFGNLRLLFWLDISGNNLTGAESPTQELGFLSSLTNCQYMKVLDVSFNPLNGILPASIGNLSTSLQTFLAFECSIKGVIPSGIGNLSSLIYMSLSRNQLTGFIPTTIGKLKQLERLYLYDNLLQGYIPPVLCHMTNLGALVYLASNKLNSTIPSNLWNLRDLLALNLSSNSLIGQLSSDIGSLKVINQVDLSSNQFSGYIPSSIDGCQSLEILYLSNNKFEGSIPQSLGNFGGLVELDLSNNNLSGLIPKSLQDLHFLQYFNVSDNRLEGEIPTAGPFVNFTAQSFVRNSALCGATRFQVPPCVQNLRRSRPKNVLLMKYIVPPIISTIILVIIMLLLIRRRKLKTIPPPTDISLGIAWRRVSYRELVQGTSSFSETKLLGTGRFSSVFKGTLSDGLNIAVKVFNLQLEGATKSFDTESEILSTIRHRNLVQIIGCCSNTEFKALILAYIPNGSLERWLHSDDYCLDLLQGLKIAIDVALALEYLHHGHTSPVVHCDIKPSNILLDEDMTAHLGDFGISKLFDEGETVIQTKTLATIGYAAPEYGSEGKVSTNGDVYSYGITLLEMFTRKNPTDHMFGEEMSLKEWVSEALQENAVSEVMAPGLVAREDQHFCVKEQCVSSIFDLAMKCLAVSPQERLNMIQTVAALQKIKAHFLASTRMHQR